MGSIGIFFIYIVNSNNSNRWNIMIYIYLQWDVCIYIYLYIGIYWDIFDIHGKMIPSNLGYIGICSMEY